MYYIKLLHFNYSSLGQTNFNIASFLQYHGSIQPL